MLSQSLVRSPNYKWWVFSAVALGTFASVINHGSVNVALPTIAEHFGTDLPTVQWVVVAEMLTISALLLPMGRLSDLIGANPSTSQGWLYSAARLHSRGSPTRSRSWWSPR